MRCVYTVPFSGDIIIPDHWEVPLLGGRCRVIERQDGRAQALEITFAGQPVNRAPLVERVSQGRVKAQITGRDALLPMVKRCLEDATAFLECYYTLDLRTAEIEIRYEAESSAEEALIAVPAFSFGRAEHPLPLTFDMITRAFMAAEKSSGPHFQATLVKAARETFAQHRFIDSFRYSFLLIEAVYGEGKFRKAGLQIALKSNPSFVAMTRSAMVSEVRARPNHGSTTSTLLAGGASVEEVIDHLVEMRGFYFHGNAKRKDGWKPERQEDAEALACLAINVAQDIANEAAIAIFEPEFAQRHFEDAARAGATILFEVHFRFREPGETFARKETLEIRTPGTRVSRKHAAYIAQEFLRRFEHGSPGGELDSAVCCVKGSTDKVFELTLFGTAKD